jgi:hypothetical protein
VNIVGDPGERFVTMMEQDVESFNIHFGGTFQQVYNQKRSLLGMILKEDIKKINVYTNGKTITIRKLLDPLQAFDEIYEQRALLSSEGWNRQRGLGGNLYGFLLN